MPRAKTPPARKTVAKKTTGRKNSRRGKKKIQVDFTDVDTGGLMPTPDGIYVAEVRSAEVDVSSNGNDMIKVRYKTNINSTVYDNIMLMESVWWKVRTVLDCMGFDTPDGPYAFDAEDLVGESVGLEIVNEEYEGKDQPRVTGFLTVEVAEAQLTDAPADDEEDGDEEEEEAPTPRKRKSRAKKQEEEEEDDDDEEEDDEEEEAPKTRRRAPKKKAPAKKKGALRPGARVTFVDGDDEYGGVIESIDDGIATVVDDEDGDWDIPVEELTKA